MPIIQSAKKRVRVAAKQRVQNLRTKRTLRDSLKDFHTAVDNKKDSTQAQSAVYSAVDTAVKKGVLSKNKAARLKSQINASSKAAGTTKPGAKAAKATKPAPTKKATTAKPAAKKAPVKKSSAKKATTKKPAAKK